MGKRALLLIIGCFLGLQVMTQTPHEVSVHVGGGLSSLMMEPGEGNASPNFGMQFGAGYFYHINSKWSVGSGVEVGTFNTIYTLDEFSYSFPVQNSIGETFDYAVSLQGYKEKLSAQFLQIPVLVKYEFSAGKSRFYVSGGLKVGIPTGRQYDYSASRLATSGYYEYEDFEYTEQKIWTFGSRSIIGKGDLMQKTAFLLSLETGMRWFLTTRLDLISSVYFNYGLNNILQSDNTNIVHYDATGLSMHSAANSVNPATGMQMIEKAIPMSVGLKVGIAFKGDRKKPVQKEEEEDAEAIARQQAAAEEAEKERRFIEQERLRIEQEQQEETKRQVEEQIRKEEEHYQHVVEVIEAPVNNFVLGQVTIPETFKEEIDEKADVLRSTPVLNIICIGHTCDLGTDEVNYRIGMKRAEAVRDYLISEGIDAGRIRIESHGPKEPLVPNTSEENRRKNRRVEIKLVEKED